MNPVLIQYDCALHLFFVRKVLNFDSYKQDGSRSAARQWILVNILWKMRFLENETIFISFHFLVQNLSICYFHRRSL